MTEFNYQTVLFFILTGGFYFIEQALKRISTQLEIVIRLLTPPDIDDD